jgi:anti-sigma factor RsiW
VIHPDWEPQRERLSAYLDGELTHSELAALETHLPTCEQCQRELAALRQTRALLRALPTPALPRSFTLPAQPAIAERRRRAPTWARPVQVIGGVAAVIGLGLLVTTAVPHVAQRPGAAGAATSASEAHAEDGATTASSPAVPSVTGAGADSVESKPAGTASAPTTPSVGASSTPGYSSIYSPSSDGHVAIAQPFPVAPVTGATLLVGGAAAIAAGGLARRRSRRAGQPAA